MKQVVLVRELGAEPAAGCLELLRYFGPPLGDSFLFVESVCFVVCRK